LLDDRKDAIALKYLCGQHLCSWHGLDAPEDADYAWLIHGGSTPTARSNAVVALTTASANGGGEEILVESSPSSGMAMRSIDMPMLFSVTKCHRPAAQLLTSAWMMGAHR
jgi:hypothetical protein